MVCLLKVSACLLLLLREYVTGKIENIEREKKEKKEKNSKNK
jgi:hypothetical protein